MIDERFKTTEKHNAKLYGKVSLELEVYKNDYLMIPTRTNEKGEKYENEK